MRYGTEVTYLSALRMGRVPDDRETCFGSTLDGSNLRKGALIVELSGKFESDMILNASQGSVGVRFECRIRYTFMPLHYQTKMQMSKLMDRHIIA